MTARKKAVPLQMYYILEITGRTGLSRSEMRLVLFDDIRKNRKPVRMVDDGYILNRFMREENCPYRKKGFKYLAYAKSGGLNKNEH